MSRADERAHSAGITPMTPEEWQDFRQTARFSQAVLDENWSGLASAFRYASEEGVFAKLTLPEEPTSEKLNDPDFRERLGLALEPVVDEFHDEAWENKLGVAAYVLLQYLRQTMREQADLDAAIRRKY